MGRKITTFSGSCRISDNPNLLPSHFHDPYSGFRHAGCVTGYEYNVILSYEGRQ